MITKGKWELSTNVLVCTEKGQLIAHCRPFNTTSQDILLKEAEDNARLIAAAPELLEACKWTARGEHHQACKSKKSGANNCNCYVGACQEAVFLAYTNKNKGGN